jgi:hypothetical protein
MMIEKVRAIWITGFLQKSLFHEVRIAVRLSEKPDAVAPPLDLLVRRPDEGEHPLASAIQVVDVFDKMDRSLLILGEPGSGKTTLLLELARDLLTRADRDPAHPIPVVFPLSTWVATRKPLTEWLVDELNLRYDVPRKIGQEWVGADDALPLLDGLDEVKLEHRAACVEAINAFRQAHGLLPMVVSSRTTDYEGLAAPLRLQGAIVVQPLTHHQADSYWTDIGPAGESVRGAIRDDPTWWELLNTPLMLSIFAAANAGPAGSRPQTQMGDSVEVRRDRLFGAYVDEMFRRHGAECRHNRGQTVHWLGWLASQMAYHGQTVFSLERLQIDWLPHSQRRAIRVWFGLALGLGGGLIYGLGAWLALAVVGGRGGLVELAVDGLAYGLVAGLLFGLVYGLVYGLSVSEIEETDVPNQGIRRSARNALIVGLSYGLVVGVVFELVFWPVLAMGNSLARGLGESLVYGLVGGLIGWMLGFSDAIICAETVRWSWIKFVEQSKVGLAYGLVFGLISGLVGGPVFGQGLGYGLVVGLAYGLAGALVYGLAGGLTVAEIETREVPNQGIRRSARNGLGFGLLVGLAGGLASGLFWGLVRGEVGENIFICLVTIGLVFGLAIGTKSGGGACLKHLLLRFWLFRNNCAPWNYVQFLDHAADRILLRKLGGGYMFIHRMLLEYFAAR